MNISNYRQRLHGPDATSGHRIDVASVTLTLINGIAAIVSASNGCTGGYCQGIVCCMALFNFIHHEIVAHKKKREKTTQTFNVTIIEHLWVTNQ